MKRTQRDRNAFFARARSLKAQCQQILNDCAHWNEHVRQPGEDPIDGDPDGSLLSCIAYCDGILSGDVYVAPAEER